MKKFIARITALLLVCSATAAFADGYALTVKQKSEIPIYSDAPAAGDYTLKWEASKNDWTLVDATANKLSGNFDGVVGATTPAAGTFTALTATTVNGNTITTGTGTLTLSGSAVLTGPSTSGTLATLAGTESLTNKTLTDFVNASSGISTAISATSGTTGTTLTNIPGLSVAVTAGKTYAFRAYVTGTSTTNSGVKLAFANSGTTTSASYTCVQNNNATQNAHTTTTTMGNAVGAATTVFTDAECWGVVVVNAAGNLTMQFAQNASHADTTTVNANGYLLVTRVN